MRTVARWSVALKARVKSSGNFGHFHSPSEQYRAKEYQEFGERCQEFVQEIEKETLAEKFTFAELEENEQDLLKLTRWLRKIQQRDFFPETSNQVANEAMVRCREALRVFTASVYEREGLPPVSTDDGLGETTDDDA